MYIMLNEVSDCALQTALGYLLLVFDCFALNC